MMIQIAIRLSTLLLCLPLAAQSVFVVDAANGPGADFVAIAPAVAAAQESDLVGLTREAERDRAHNQLADHDQRGRHGLRVLGRGVLCILSHGRGVKGKFGLVSSGDGVRMMLAPWGTPS